MFSSLISLLCLSSYASAGSILAEDREKKLEKGLGLNQVMGLFLIVSGLGISVYGSLKEEIDSMAAKHSGDWLAVSTSEEAPEMVSLDENSDEKVKVQSVPSDDIGWFEALENANKKHLEDKGSDPAVMACGVFIIAIGCFVLTHS